MGTISGSEYQKKVESIFTRFPSVQNVAFDKAYKPGLENMLKFASALGNPHEKIRSIHVAGTNGKGSVSNMLASCLSAAGLKVGLYTSPHILDFRERMRILDGGSRGPARLVSKEYVHSFLCEKEELMDELSLSFFEITTGLAFKWFADEEVDVAVIETGLGGRLDSTNIITPDLSIVTNIALDHCAILGSTLEEIAGEKAGIFKKDVPALAGEALPQTRPVFELKADGFCPLYFAEDKDPSMWQSRSVILRRMDLRGKYQEKNLRTLMAALDILSKMPGYEGLADSSAMASAIVATAARMDFHGRWERLSSHPFVIADIGHNPAALRENFAQLQAMCENGDCSSLIMVYAVMADKDLDGIIPLMPADATYVFTNPATARSLPGKDIAERYRTYCASVGRSTRRIHEAEDVKSALTMAFNLAHASMGRDSAVPLIFVGGSTYLVSEVVRLLNPNRKV